MSRQKASNWVKEVVHRRDRVCQSCGTKGSRKNRLTVHHIKPKRDYPELINDPDNCVLLCRECHDEVEQDGD